MRTQSLESELDPIAQYQRLRIVYLSQAARRIRAGKNKTVKEALESIIFDELYPQMEKLERKMHVIEVVIESKDYTEVGEEDKIKRQVKNSIVPEQSKIIKYENKKKT